MINPPVNGFVSHHWRLSVSILFLFCVCTIAFVCAYLFDYSSIDLLYYRITVHKQAVEARKMIPDEFPLICTLGNTTQRTCPASYYPSKFPAAPEEENAEAMEKQPICPEYFRWIHEDLMPWRETGITLKMVEMAKTRRSNFRLVIVNGTVYIDSYLKPFQTRDLFTQWGILQLLRRYPGKLPDLDLIFYCGDIPPIVKECYPNKDAPAPPPIFGYDGDNTTLGIVFPDWSFCGWPEIKIKPWESLQKDLKEGNEKKPWVDRDPHAYWKGNTDLSESRMDLLSCNASNKQDWNARIYNQDWGSEVKNGFKNSNLASQCNHRYKIYIDGRGWSVSEKYILACDSLALLVRSKYYDFFTRGLKPLKHYWPIRDTDKCRAIKFAVEWGNIHQEEAQAIGRAASDFVQDELQMKYIYDYMFHVLKEYAKLLKYKPSVPPNAVEICSEALACPAEGLMKTYTMESLVKGPSDKDPCSLAPPYDAATLHSVLETREDTIQQVEAWERQYWDTQNMTRS